MTHFPSTSSDNQILIPPENYTAIVPDENPPRTIWNSIKSIIERNIISFICVISFFILLIIPLIIIFTRKKNVHPQDFQTINNNIFNCNISFTNATWDKNGPIFVNRLGKCGSDADTLCFPHDLFIDNIHDNLYVVDTRSNRIQKYSLNQPFDQYQSAVGMTVANRGLIAPSSIFVDVATEDMYILDYDSNDIKDYRNPPTYRVHLWPKNAINGRILLSERGEYSFGTDSHIVLDQDMNIYVETRFHIRKWLVSTKYKQVVTVAGIQESGGNSPDQLFDPRGLYIDNNLTMYIVDWNNHRIQKWIANQNQGITLTSNLSYPYGITQDCQGNIYFGDAFRQAVYQFNQETNQTRIVIDESGNDGILKPIFRPFGVKLDKYGNMFVVDYQSSQIKKFSIL